MALTCTLFGHKFVWKNLDVATKLFVPVFTEKCVKCGYRIDHMAKAVKKVGAGQAYLAGSPFEGERMEEDKTYIIK